jgi:hypothetical protein
MSMPGAALIQSYKPESFLERGVAAPFTTPQLAGARIRYAARTGTEFVLPNPSGGRGVYIMDWSAVRQLCRPTVHDTLLHQRVARLPSMDPGSVRAVARQLAGEGHAGKDASIAAAASAEAEKQELILVNFLLLVMLMEQVEPAGLAISADTEHTRELDLRARRIVTNVGAAIARSVAQISADLETLSLLYVPIGLDADMPPGRLPRFIARLDAVGAALAAWSKKLGDDPAAVLASSLSRSALVTARCAAAAVGATRALTHDICDLLRRWATERATIARIAAAPEWILDGWERFCLLWETTDQPHERRAVMREMAQLVSVLPRESEAWNEACKELESLQPVLRAARLNVGWRDGGAAQMLIARNERMQGLIS